MNRTDEKVDEALRSLATLRLDAQQNGRDRDARLLQNAANELRRARFHERENYDRCVSLLHPKRTAKSGRGDGPCAECGTSDNPVWFTDDVLWNNVVRRWASGEDGYAATRWDTAGDAILCLPCFIEVVEERGYRPTSWRVIPVWPIRRAADEQPISAWEREFLDREHRTTPPDPPTSPVAGGGVAGAT